MTNIPTKTLKTLVERWSRILFFFSFLLVLLATLFPYNFSFGKIVRNFDFSLPPSPDLNDWIENIFLFLPFGFGLTGWLGKRKLRGIRTLIPVVIASAALSLTVETLQMFLERDPSISDVLANSIGGFIGFVCFRLGGTQIYSYTLTLIEKIRSCNSIKHLTGYFIGYITLTFLIVTSLQSAINLSNWDSTFPLLLGNERTGNRPWQGSISEVHISDKAISEEEVKHLFSNQTTSAFMENSLLASYQLGGKGNYPDKTGHLPELVWRGQLPDAQNRIGVSLTSSHWLETTTPAIFLNQKLRQNSQFTLSTTIATADTLQSGPARIISLSSDPFHRNFTLGQQKNNLVIRLRTPLTGEDGSNPELIVPNVFVDFKLHHIIITYAGSVVRVYIDRWQNSNSFELTPAATLFSYLFTIKPFKFQAYNFEIFKVVYYGIIFVPLGLILASIAINIRGGFIFNIILICSGAIFPSLVLEILLSSEDSRGVKIENILIGIVFNIGSMLIIKRWFSFWFISKKSLSNSD